jgi:hypothetical protein
MTRRTLVLAGAVALASGLGYAAAAAQQKPAPGANAVTVYKSPT